MQSPISPLVFLELSLQMRKEKWARSSPSSISPWNIFFSQCQIASVYLTYSAQGQSKGTQSSRGSDVVYWTEKSLTPTGIVAEERATSHLKDCRTPRCLFDGCVTGKGDARGSLQDTCEHGCCGHAGSLNVKHVCHLEFEFSSVSSLKMSISVLRLVLHRRVAGARFCHILCDCLRLQCNILKTRSWSFKSL